MKKKLAFIMSLLLLSSSIAACNSNQKETTQENKVLLSVETQSVKSGNIESSITVSSKIEPNKELNVIPKMAGIVQSVNYSLGDRVSQGATLFKIDDSDINVQVNQAKAALNVAQANYDMATNATTVNQIQQVEASVSNLQLQYDDVLEKLADMQELYAEGAIAKSDVDTLQNNADALKLQLETAQKSLDIMKNNVAVGTKNVSQAGVEQAKAGVQTAQHQLTNTVITAGMSGIITTNNVVKGQMVSMQSPSMVISDIDTVKLKFQVSENAINNINAGSKIYVTIDAISDKPFVSSVTKVAQVADKQTSLYPVEVSLSNPYHKIKPGMFASVKIVTSNKSGIITLPIDTVIQKEDETFVYIVDDKNIVHKTKVILGVQNDKDIEITSGLSQGMNVVVKGQDFISDKSEVNIVAPENK